MLGLQSRVLYRDGQIIVLNKPAGLAGHPGPKTAHSLEASLVSLRFGLSEDPVPAHRLDRDTSGCLVMARNARSRRRLGRLFTASAIRKTYWAIVEGRPPNVTGEIDLSLFKQSDKTGWRVIVDSAGLAAHTHYRTLAEEKGLSLLELHPLTGRTHQIRVHCQALGCPVLGDPIYGTALPEGHYLHARRVVIPRDTAMPIDVTAPLPDHFQKNFQAWLSAFDPQ